MRRNVRGSSMKKVFFGVFVMLIAAAPLALNAGQKTAMKMYDKTVPLITVTGIDILKTYIESGSPSAYDEAEYRLTKLSKESLETVAAYYKKLMTESDEISEIVPGSENEFTKGFRIIFNDIHDGEKVQVASVEIMTVDNDAKMKMMGQYVGGDTSALDYSLMPFPLLMMTMVGPMYGHTDKEIAELKKKYMKLTAMFYRSYQKDIEDDMADDYNKTIMLAYQKVSGANKKMTPKQFEKWMQTQGMAAAGQIMKKEAWPIWMDCLIELDKLAYPVKIVHEGPKYWK